MRGLAKLRGRKAKIKKGYPQSGCGVERSARKEIPGGHLLAVLQDAIERPPVTPLLQRHDDTQAFLR